MAAGYPSGVLRAYENLFRWAGHEHWGDLRHQIVEEHRKTACDDVGVSIERLPDVLDREAFTDAAGAALEDFWSGRAPPTNRAGASSSTI